MSTRAFFCNLCLFTFPVDVFFLCFFFFVKVRSAAPLNSADSSSPRDTVLTPY